jgi:ABC-type glutathione transport system ATPase component
VNLSKIGAQYTLGLTGGCAMVLRFETVQKSFRDSDGIVPVLRDVSFDLEAGQTLAL